MAGPPCGLGESLSTVLDAPVVTGRLHFRLLLCLPALLAVVDPDFRGSLWSCFLLCLGCSVSTTDLCLYMLFAP